MSASVMTPFCRDDRKSFPIPFPCLVLLLVVIYNEKRLACPDDVSAGSVPSLRNGRAADHVLDGNQIQDLHEHLIRQILEMVL